MSSIKIKICGNARAEDVIAADDLGADFVGVVCEVSASKRSVSREKAVELLACAKRARRAALFFNAGLASLVEMIALIKPDIVHLTGEEPPEVIVVLRKKFDVGIFKSIHLPPAGESKPPVAEARAAIKKYADAGADAIVIDTRDIARNMYGGTGKVSDWAAAKELVAASPLPVFLAGGLNLENVERAISEVKPYGVDLAGGLEKEICVKDFELMKKFIAKVTRMSS